MKPPPDTPEFRRFTNALKHMLTVPKSEIVARIEEDKKKRKPIASASRDSGDSSTQES